jgi:hydrogenase maturation protein HypF
MAAFTMCPDCEREYHDPKNRRFHAQPNACSACGPQVEFKGQSSAFKVNDEGTPIKAAVDMLKQGGIVAIKGLGGFHLACDATNDDAVKRLRERKRKSNKPFAVMSPDVDVIERYCEVSDKERELLLSNSRPVVLLNKKRASALSEAVSPNNKYLGVMLPYTPLHYLLFFADGNRNPDFQALVMTSGNLSEEPIVRDNDEAAMKLSGLVDGFLLYNRDIFMRVDDSVVRVLSSEFKVQSMTQDVSYNSELSTLNCELSFIRRSRGYAPEPIYLHDDGPEVLGCGADLKNTFTLTKGPFAIPSQHIGDMENYETLTFFEESLENLKAVYRAEPVAIAHDLHPGYLSTQWALNQKADLYGIQHHYAHIGSVMAENGLKEKVIGVAFDGTGYGTDGNLWGGEFLVAGIEGFERAGQFKSIPLPGGEAAIREPWRTAISYVMDAVGDKTEECLANIGFAGRYGQESTRQVMAVARSQELSPRSSGAGRLFDAVSALLGICDRNTFEGEAAMALEFHVREGIPDEYPVEHREENGYTVVDFSRTVIAIVSDVMQGADRGTIATKFHNTVASVIVTVVRNVSARAGTRDVALSGGTFQNLYLLNRATRLLCEAGMKVYINRNVPCNDACISLGQAYLVRERLKKASLLFPPLQGED